MEREHTVSLCMIVKNEENCLEACLQSVKSLVDEIIIVDTGSTDSTLDIAKAYHAKTILSGMIILVKHVINPYL